MTLEQFKSIKEGQLITIHNKKGKVIDIFHYSKIFELHHHNYDGEDYYYLGVTIQPRLEDISKTTIKDIDELVKHKIDRFDEQLRKLQALRFEIK